MVFGQTGACNIQMFCIRNIETVNELKSIFLFKFVNKKCK